MRARPAAFAVLWHRKRRVPVRVHLQTPKYPEVHVQRGETGATNARSAEMWDGMELSKTLRVSDAAHKRLEQIQTALREQKGEHHAIISIVEKVVLNAPVDKLYAISLNDEVLDEVPDQN